jgi:hypothetical protein
VKRIARQRPSLPALAKEFEIDCKLFVAGEGITEAEALAHIQECIRYASAAFIFRVRHPVGDKDRHRRGKCATHDRVELRISGSKKG